MHNKSSDAIHIVLSINNSYAPMLAVTMASILANAAPADHHYFHVISNDLTDTNKNLILQLNQTLRAFEIEYLPLTPDEKQLLPKPPKSQHISMDGYSNLFSASLLPGIAKVIHLDSDLVVMESLAELWQTELAGNHIAGVVDPVVMRQSPPPPRWARKVRALLSPGCPYLNFGVMVFNLEQWRKDGVEAAFFANMEKYEGILGFPDQDIVNIMFNASSIELPRKWNVLIELTPPDLLADLPTNLGIIHWAGVRKPWLFRNCLGSEYFWRYARLTPCYDTLCLLHGLACSLSLGVPQAQMDAAIGTLATRVEAETSAARAEAQAAQTALAQTNTEIGKLKIGLNAETKVTRAKVDALIALHAFPNRAQCLLIRLYDPLVKLFAPWEYHAKLRLDPSDFFAASRSTANKFMRWLLILFGPTPKKTGFSMKKFVATQNKH